MTAHIFDPAPNFVAETTVGPLDFYEYKAESWAILLSCPFDFTPVCTTELATLAAREHEFTDRGVKVLITSVDNVETHHRWRADIREVFGQEITYPMIADTERKVARAYRMIRDDDTVLPVQPGRWLVSNPDFTVRTAFVITPANRIALTMSYPPNVGLSFDELLRVVDSLQMSRHKLATPADWRQGEDVVVGRVLSNDIATAKFGPIRTAMHYLRFTPQPGWLIRQQL